MANLQYIGARYVPKFYLNPDDQSNDWKSGVLYEALMIVTYNNDSYTSKKVVPDDIGDPENNPEYWACTTKYTAALVALQNTVAEISDDMDAIKNSIVIPQMFGAVGDGISDDTNAFKLMRDSGANIFIPEATYLLSDEITLTKVIADEGSYTSYKPMYAKKLSLPMELLSWESQNIPLMTNCKKLRTISE